MRCPWFVLINSRLSFFAGFCSAPFYNSKYLNCIGALSFFKDLFTYLDDLMISVLLLISDFSVSIIFFVDFSFPVNRFEEGYR